MRIKPCLFCLLLLVENVNPIQYGLFLKHPLVTLVFLKVEGQSLEAWGISMCFLQKMALIFKLRASMTS